MDQTLNMFQLVKAGFLFVKMVDFVKCLYPQILNEVAYVYLNIFTMVNSFFKLYVLKILFGKLIRLAVITIGNLVISISCLIEAHARDTAHLVAKQQTLRYIYLCL